jgi:hypothetical protein
MIPEPTQAELAVIGRIYKSGAADLAGLLDSTAFQRGKASILLRQVDEISKRIGLESDHWVTTTARNKLQANAVAIFRQIDPIALSVGGGEWQAARPEFLKINERAVNVFARQLAVDLARKNQGMAQDARRLISRTSQKVLADPAMSEIIAKGLVAGGNLNDISRGLRSRLEDGGRELLASGKMSADELRDICDLDAGYIQAGKVRMKIGEYAQLVAHYQLRQAVTEATKDRLKDAGEMVGDSKLFDLVKIVGPLSRQCRICDELVGRVYSLSGDSDKYEPLADLPHGGPPFHPHCTHNIAPYIEQLQ